MILVVKIKTIFPVFLFWQNFCLNKQDHESTKIRSILLTRINILDFHINMFPGLSIQKKFSVKGDQQKTISS